MKCDYCEIVTKEMSDDRPEVILIDDTGMVWTFCCMEDLILWCGDL